MTFPINCILFPEYKWSENPKREKKINLKAKELKKKKIFRSTSYIDFSTVKEEEKRME